MLNAGRNLCKSKVHKHASFSPFALHHHTPIPSKSQALTFTTTHPKAQSRRQPYKPSSRIPSAKRHIPPPTTSSQTPPAATQSSPPPVATSSALDPSSTTLPPPLTLPDRPPGTPWYKYYFSVGRTLLKFYKTGLLALFANRKILFQAPLRPHLLSANARKALLAGEITRAQYVFIKRVKADLLKVPVFAVLLLVCGEFTALLVPFVGAIVPKVVWLPVQWERARRKAKERRERAGKKVGYARKEAGGGEVKGLDFSYFPKSREGVERGEHWNEMVVNGVRFNAWPGLWDPLVYLKLLPGATLLKRLENRADELRLDDRAIARDGGAKEISVEEVKLCLDARGTDVRGMEESEMKAILGRFIEKNREEHKKKRHEGGTKGEPWGSKV
ncbi:uncharacterized protein KY384_005829 [Bacidia gigantensis]|uniref:uncharacterized protein n=1 Tax=Bacidia gigantensis TaxID=2732470 RepID=UPI001D04A256|nr:uncharacterized protein KY384_005829 [Bacidia gigantensis]KAG8529194.1 hypothetical protein KY384_005829 [Bacidia gigantensis]